eukprot:TRINITY_DN1731_c0_g1_i2.p1 TRINITY_DN1731_c0_g1~~TRINITY_DN1731_c0_g1_i2.p1  ORF type:complete len:321 (-),score=55.41 TRINITY_DN1731_c0_g1_i2:119-1081(-)
MEVVTCVIWACYSFLLGDVWLFLSAGPPAAMWLSFNIKAIKLLAQEEGELNWELDETWGSAFFKDTFGTSRVQMMKRTEQMMTAALFFSLLLTLFCCPWKNDFERFQVVSETVRNDIMATISCATSLLCFGSPITRLMTLLKRRDASAIYIPLLFATLLHNTFWMVYGILTGALAVCIPHVAGFLTGLTQLVLVIKFRRADSKDDAPESGSVVPHEGTSVDEKMPDDDLEKCSTESGLSSSVPQSPADGQNSALAELPDLTETLKKQGTYEDYLKWQRGYQSWRRGCAQGASGELLDIPSRLSLKRQASAEVPGKGDSIS